MKIKATHRFSPTGYWHESLGAPFARDNLSQNILKGVQNLANDINVRINPLTGLVWWLQGDLMPGVQATNIAQRENLAAQTLEKYGRPLLGLDYDPDMFLVESPHGQRVRFMQIISGDATKRVYGASILFGFNEKGSLTWICNSCYVLPSDFSLPPTEEYPTFDQIEQDVTPIVQEHVFLTLPPEFRGQLIIPTITDSLIQALSISEIDLDAEQRHKLSRVSLDTMNDTLYEPLATGGREPIPIRAGKSSPVQLPRQFEDFPSNIQPAMGEQFKLIMPQLNDDEVIDITNRFIKQQLVEFPPQDRILVKPNVAYGEESQVIFPVLNSDGRPEFLPAWSAISHETKSGLEWEVIIAQLNGEFEILASGDRSVNSISLLIKNNNNNLTDIEPAQFNLRDKFIHDTITDAIGLFNQLKVSAGLNNIQMPGVSDNFQIVVGAGRTQYLSDDRRIEIGDKDTNLKIEDPGLDPQVLYHEYAHAVVDIVQPDFYSSILMGAFNEAINEGVAFYYGCALFFQEAVQNGTDPAQWGQSAYHDKKWQEYHNLALKPQSPRPGYDFLPAYHVFPDYDGNCKYPLPRQDECKKYACGFLWARALWDVRQQIGEQADHIILRALRLCNGPQDMATFAEAILHELKQINHSRQEQVRQEFVQRRILPQASIYDLSLITLNGNRFVLMITEKPGGGCFISGTQPWQWQVLGTNCPENVIALTTLPLPNDEVLVFIASVDWTNQFQTQFHVCRLQGNGNSYQIIADWAAIDMSTFPSAFSSMVFSLTAFETANDFILFVGTENGLYWFDNQWHHDSLGFNPDARPLFQVDILTSATASSKLMIAGLGILRIYDLPFNGTHIDLQPMDTQYVMTALPLTNTNNWLVGLGANNIKRFDGNAWLSESIDQADVRTVYKLWSGANNSLIAATNDGVYQFNELADSWQPFQYQRPSGFSSHLLNNQPVLSLCSWQQNNIFNLLAGTSRGDLWHFNGVSASSLSLP